MQQVLCRVQLAKQDLFRLLWVGRIAKFNLFSCMLCSRRLQPLVTEFDILLIVSGSVSSGFCILCLPGKYSTAAGDIASECCCCTVTSIVYSILNHFAQNHYVHYAKLGRSQVH